MRLLILLAVGGVAVIIGVLALVWAFLRGLRRLDKCDQ